MTGLVCYTTVAMDNSGKKIELYDQIKYPHLQSVKNIHRKDEEMYQKVSIITKQEKLDGTQGAIFFENDKIIFASRNVVLLTTDNANFREYMTKKNIKDLEKYFADYPDHMLIGEWMKSKEFFVFDEARIVSVDDKLESKYLNFYERSKILKKNYYLDVIQPEAIVKNDEPKNYEKEEISGILNENATFDTDTIEGYVFKIYVADDDGKLFISDQMKIINRKYIELMELKTKKEKNPSKGKESLVTRFFNDECKVLDKVYKKIVIEKCNETNADPTDLLERLDNSFLEKHEDDFLRKILEEFKEYENDNNEYMRFPDEVKKKILKNYIFKRN